MKSRRPYTLVLPRVLFSFKPALDRGRRLSRETELGTHVYSKTSELPLVATGGSCNDSVRQAREVVQCQAHPRKNPHSSRVPGLYGTALASE